MKSSLRLSVTPPKGAPYDFELDRDEIVIGRASDVDLPLADRFLSRQHARIIKRQGQLLIEDLGSRNGTTVNGRQIEGPTPIAPGDTIVMCGSSLIVHDDKREPAAAPPEQDFSSVTLFRSAKDFLEPASEIQLEGDAKALRRYAERLSLLNQVHHALGASMELDGLLELILDGIFRHLQPEECAIFLRQEDGEMTKAATRATVPGGENLLFSRALVREVTEKRVAALVYDAQMDERFAAAQSIMTSGVRSLAAAPLLDGEDVLGMMVIGSRVAVRAYSEEDLELLVTLSAVAAMRLRNLRLAEEAAERHAMEQELALARHIQTNLLPEHLPDLAQWELYGGTLPSRTVSGDMYQVLQRKDGTECVLMVADVSGKGMAASLLTASLEALSIGPIESGLPADEICAAVSQRLYLRTPPEKYATAFLGILDVDRGSLAYTNAGHNPALLVHRDGSVEQLTATGTPLGLLPNAPYARREVHLGQGDLLAIYTDGVTETFDLDDEEYGTERLASFLQDQINTPLDQIAIALETTLDQFANGAPPGDDVTLVMIRRR